jgi:putative ATPase
LPTQLVGTTIYEPKPYGREKALGEKLAQLKQMKKERKEREGK